MKYVTTDSDSDNARRLGSTTIDVFPPTTHPKMERKIYCYHAGVTIPLRCITKFSSSDASFGLPHLLHIYIIYKSCSCSSVLHFLVYDGHFRCEFVFALI